MRTSPLAVSGKDSAHSAKIDIRRRSTNHLRSSRLGAGVPGHETPENGASFDCPTTSALATKDSQASNPNVGSSRRSASETASCRALMIGPIEAGTSDRASMVAKTAVSRFAIVLPPAETDVPDPVRTTRFSIRNHSEIRAWRRTRPCFWSSPSRRSPALPSSVKPMS